MKFYTRSSNKYICEAVFDIDDEDVIDISDNVLDIPDTITVSNNLEFSEKLEKFIDELESSIKNFNPFIELLYNPNSPSVQKSYRNLSNDSTGQEIIENKIDEQRNRYNDVFKWLKDFVVQNYNIFFEIDANNIILKPVIIPVSNDEYIYNFFDLLFLTLGCSFIDKNNVEILVNFINSTRVKCKYIENNQIDNTSNICDLLPIELPTDLQRFLTLNTSNNFISFKISWYFNINSLLDKIFLNFIKTITGDKSLTYSHADVNALFSNVCYLHNINQNQYDIIIKCLTSKNLVYWLFKRAYVLLHLIKPSDDEICLGIDSPNFPVGLNVVVQNSKIKELKFLEEEAEKILIDKKYKFKFGPNLPKNCSLNNIFDEIKAKGPTNELYSDCLYKIRLISSTPYYGKSSDIYRLR